MHVVRALFDEASVTFAWPLKSRMPLSLYYGITGEVGWALRLQFRRTHYNSIGMIEVNLMRTNVLLAKE